MPRKKTPIANSSDEADERADIANANGSSSTSPFSDAVAEITANISKIIDTPQITREIQYSISSSALSPKSAQN